MSIAFVGGFTMTRIDLVTEGVYRISSQFPGFPITLNQFVIEGQEAAALIHTGTFPLYDAVRKAVAEVMDPKRLRYVVVPHFEADECGGMGRFIDDAPGATLVCSAVGQAVNLSGWDCQGPVRGVQDGDVVDLGGRRLRFWETPHVHHWDSMMVFEETTGSLFPADLFLQPGDQPPIVREDLGKAMCETYRTVGIFPAVGPVLSVADRVERTAPAWIHPMHGGSLPAEVIPGYLRALREEPFAYDGRVLGRPLVG
jgi:flavorubredoxin